MDRNHLFSSVFIRGLFMKNGILVVVLRISSCKTWGSGNITVKPKKFKIIYPNNFTTSFNISLIGVFGGHLPSHCSHSVQFEAWPSRPLYRTLSPSALSYILALFRCLKFSRIFIPDRQGMHYWKPVQLTLFWPAYFLPWKLTFFLFCQGAREAFSCDLYVIFDVFISDIPLRTTLISV